MRSRPLVAALAALALSFGVMSYAGAAPDDGGKAAATSSSAEARRALSDAKALFRSDKGSLEGRDATLVLRDLMMVRADLTGADRRAADRILARPTDPDDGEDFTLEYSVVEAPPVCGPDICVHYVTTTGDAPPLTDTNPANGVPDQVDQVLTTLELVHGKYAAAGYRQPKGDGTTGGGTDLIDVYLGNVGGDQIYGYCAPESETSPTGWDRAAYCVLDDDFSLAEFPTNTPTENMKVTAAHEYFHAVQFAYDAFEDGWFMEATATWAEDELYDGVNDSRNYLSESQLRAPHVSLDDNRFMSVYGNWIFFRYLTEKYRTSAGGMPTLIRSMWNRADGSLAGADQYSLQAVSNTIKAAGSNLTRTYASFADANRRPRTTYDEGKQLNYPTSPLVFRPVTLSPRASKTTWGSFRLDHLTNGTVRFKPKGLTQKSWKLKAQVNMAPRTRGSAAVATVSYKSGKTRTYHLSLNAKGDGSKRVPFSSRTVKWVELTLVNASERMTCWRGRPFSCQGTPKDDNLVQKMRGVASR